MTSTEPLALDAIQSHVDNRIEHLRQKLAAAEASVKQMSEELNLLEQAAISLGTIEKDSTAETDEQ